VLQGVLKLWGRKGMEMEAIIYPLLLTFFYLYYMYDAQIANKMTKNKQLYKQP